MSVSNNDELLTTNEVADWLKVDPDTLRRWRRTGRGPASTKLGARSVRYRRGDVGE